MTGGMLRRGDVSDSRKARARRGVVRQGAFNRAPGGQVSRNRALAKKGIFARADTGTPELGRTKGVEMHIRYAVTFEFMNRPPLTHRGTVEARRGHVCAARAIKVAQVVLRPVNWSSVVFVALERLGEAEMQAETEAVESADAPELDRATP